MVMDTYQKLKSKMPFSALVKHFRPKRQTKCLRYFIFHYIFFEKKQMQRQPSTVIFRETVIALVSRYLVVYFLVQFSQKFLSKIRVSSNVFNLLPGCQCYSSVHRSCYLILKIYPKKYISKHRNQISYSI